MTTTDAQNPGQDVQDWIRQTVNSHDVVLFMKGTQQFPQCGFSAQVAQIMALLDVDAKDFNVLEDMSVREGVKQFSNWPTIPQLYIKGEFVGGCDIVREMYEAGELQDHLAKQGISFNKSTVVA
ncbi:MAG: Grx4 family monothiol glutaredoxin [Pseudomonadota bacterium]